MKMDPGGGLEGKTKLDGSPSHEHNEKLKGGGVRGAAAAQTMFPRYI